MLSDNSISNTYMKFVLLVFVCFNFCQGNAQKLIDYLDVAAKNFRPELNDPIIAQNNLTTQLDFGYFVEPQYTISGAQKAYVSVMQEIPWIGKSAAYTKIQKHTSLQSQYLIEQQKELLKFKVKELYYQLYNFKHKKDIYVDLSDKLRKHIESVEKDTLNTSVKSLLKLFERKEQLANLIEKLQLVDGDYQNALLQFNGLLKQDSFQEVELPLELAMPDEDQTISFSDSYESPLFMAYENQLLAHRQAQKYKNRWLPSLSLGLRYSQVTGSDGSFVQLPADDIVEPRLRVQWDLFSKKEKTISKKEIVSMTEQKVLDITSLLQISINDQISARISYFSVQEKLDYLKKLKTQISEKNMSLSSDELFQLEFLEANYKVKEIQSVTNYYVSSSKMLLYQ